MGAYVGINSTPAGGYTPVAKKIKKIYVGDEKGIARLIKKAYVGVDGVAKLFWDGIDIPDEQLVNYLMLYDNGDECVDVTGGWDNYLTTGVSSYWNTIGKLTKNTSNIQMLDITANTNHKEHRSLFTKQVVNISEYAGALTVSELISVELPVSGTQYRFGLQLRSALNGSSTYLKLACYFIANSAVDKYINSIKFSDYISDYSTTDAYVGFIGLTEDASMNAKAYTLVFLKQDNWQQLCEIAGLTASDYTNEASLCSNSTAITQILSNSSAVDFMLKQCTGTFMASFVASSTCLTALNNSTNKTKIHANEHWSKFLMFVS